MKARKKDYGDWRVESETAPPVHLWVMDVSKALATEAGAKLPGTRRRYRRQPTSADSRDRLPGAHAGRPLHGRRLPLVARRVQDRVRPPARRPRALVHAPGPVGRRRGHGLDPNAGGLAGHGRGARVVPGRPLDRLLHRRRGHRLLHDGRDREGPRLRREAGAPHRLLRLERRPGGVAPGRARRGGVAAGADGAVSHGSRIDEDDGDHRRAASLPLGGLHARWEVGGLRGRHPDRAVGGLPHIGRRTGGRASSPT